MTADQDLPRENAPAPSEVTPDQCFAALVTTLTEQLQCAREGRLDRVIDLAQQADALLARARAAGARPDPQCRTRLLDLHQRLRLTLAQQQEEVGRRRAQLARGKGSLEAYRAATAPVRRGPGG